MNRCTKFCIPVVEPYDWRFLYDVLYCHRLEGVESFVDGRYRRAMRIGESEFALEIGYQPWPTQIEVSIFHKDDFNQNALEEQIRQIFDVDLDLNQQLTQLSGTDPITKLYLQNLGLRVPGAWAGFETAVCIILAQLVSLEQARTMTKRLIEKYGDVVLDPVFPECRRFFPTARILKSADLTGIGLAKLRQSAVRDLANLVDSGEVDLSPSTDQMKTRKTLLDVRGIGKWTVEMIAFRCLGDRNAFPSTDLVVKRALIENGLPKGDWSPWNAYILLTLWKTYAKALNPISKSNTDRPSVP